MLSEREVLKVHMKKLKVLCSLFGVSVFCCMGLMTDVSARAETYDVGNKSEVHTYRSVSQYYYMSGIVTVINNDRYLSNLSISWSSNGSGQYSVGHGDYKYYNGTDSYKQYIAESRITVSGVTNKANLLCKVWW